MHDSRLLTLARSGNEQARAELTQQISERIVYLVRQRAAAYDQLDVLNESVHRGRYLQTFGVEGVARFSTRSPPRCRPPAPARRLFLNEYNLLQFLLEPAHWGADSVRELVPLAREDLLDAGAKLDGLGVQYYADGRGGRPRSATTHNSPARIFGVLQNLAGTGLDLTLTEFT